MLHELLVALSGVSGSIFVDRKKQGFQVSLDNIKINIKWQLI